MPNINALLINKTINEYNSSIIEWLCYTVSLSNSRILASDFTYKNKKRKCDISYIPCCAPYTGQFPCCVFANVLLPFVFGFPPKQSPAPVPVTSPQGCTLEDNFCNKLSPNRVAIRSQSLFLADFITCFLYRKDSSVPSHFPLSSFHHLRWCWGNVIQ